MLSPLVARTLSRNNPHASDLALSHLKPLDANLCQAIRAGAIRLLRVSWLLAQQRRDGGWRLVQRQALERLQAESPLGRGPFLSTAEALALFHRGDRSVLALSYGWLSQGDPDPFGARLAALTAFLRAHAGTCVRTSASELGLFWDYASLPQAPRSAAEQALFRQALAIMGDMYASALTAVLQLKTVPPPPLSAGASARYNDRPYDVRGWCVFESGVATLMQSVLQSSPVGRELRKICRLPKLVEIGMGPDNAWCDLSAGDYTGEGELVGSFTARLDQATFTGKGDEEVVLGLYRNYLQTTLKGVFTACKAYNNAQERIADEMTLL